jgi:hypothetical protein
MLSRWIDHFTPLRYFFLSFDIGSSWGYYPPLTALSIDGRLSKRQPQEFHAFVHLGRIRGDLGFQLNLLCVVHVLRTP